MFHASLCPPARSAPATGAELGDVEGQLPSAISGGMRKRAATVGLILAPFRIEL